MPARSGGWPSSRGGAAAPQWRQSSSSSSSTTSRRSSGMDTLFAATAVSTAAHRRTPVRITNAHRHAVLAIWSELADSVR
ncbi:Os03g0148350 [Oryza sativa Japonica Group]|uniref:Os03g0148350 protein n=1 Tax=Oryza sativa subsp. japonica TaxID=39947 RepID=A0A0P0VSZ6_ORYSJ|nr:Os03g0148350 [Oryza sativa Japonica Group]